LKLAPKRLNVLIWALIYGGLLLGAIGVALHRAGQPYGAAVIVCCAIAVIVGIALIVVRSRLPDA
jgi:hypothetical protein